MQYKDTKKNKIMYEITQTEINMSTDGTNFDKKSVLEQKIVESLLEDQEMITDNKTILSKGDRNVISQEYLKPKPTDKLATK
ncbi:857_t:CDS:1, partial [Gigaspora margarita]